MFITISVFFTTFLQFSVTPVLAPWDPRELPNYLFLNEFLFKQGLYTDINSAWFQESGILICANLYANAFWPLIEFSYTYAMRWAFRALDQWRLIPNNYKKTSQKTILGFMDLYSGPYFAIHWKYSTILNVVFTCFLFGPVLPILFPIAFLNLFILYTVERLMVAYSYQKPPMYDQTVNNYTINMLYIAPILYTISSIWFFSNQQVFRNHFERLEPDYLYPMTGHKVAQLLR